MMQHEKYVSFLLFYRTLESRDKKNPCDNYTVCTNVQDSIIHFLGPPTNTYPQMAQNAPHHSHPFSPSMSLVEVV